MNGLETRLKLNIMYMTSGSLLWLLAPQATVPEASVVLTLDGVFSHFVRVCVAFRGTQASVKSCILKYRQPTVAKWQP